MHVSIVVTLIALTLCLISSADAFVVTIYENDNCTGASKRVNTWVSSCSHPGMDFRSVRVEKFWRVHHTAALFHHINCDGLRTLGSKTYDLNGWDPDFKVGACLRFKESARETQELEG